MATLRELITRWKFKTDSKPIMALRRGLTGVKKVAGTVAKGLGFVAAGAGAAAFAVWKLVKATATEADELLKMSQRVGVSFKWLQKMKYAAELGGASVDDVAKALRRVSTAALDATRGSKDAVDSFREIGVSVKDNRGDLKDNESLMRETLIGLSLVESESRKVALAQKLFGRSGTALLPMLKGGALGVAELMAKADKLGLVLSDKAGKAAAKFNDELATVKAQVKGVGMRFGADLLPMLTEYITKSSKWVQANRGVIDQNMGAVVSGIGDAFKVLTADMKPGDFEDLGVEIREALVTVAVTIKWLGKIAKAGWQAISFPFRLAGSVIGAVGDEVLQLGEKFAKVFDFTNVGISDVANLALSVLMAPWRIVAAAAKTAFEVIAGVIDKFFPGFKADAMKVFDGITAWFKALPSVIWKGLVDGFQWALAAVLGKINAFKGKLGKVGDMLFGAGNITMPAALQPAAAGAAAGGGAPVTINQTNNITTAPGAPASEAARVGESVKTATTRDLRRAGTDVARP